MPDGQGKPELRDDPYAWAHAQIAALRAVPPDTAAFDRDGLLEFLEESAHDMVARVKSQLVNLMAHLAKSALTRNPQVIGHWRSECDVFHDAILDECRRSMRKDIDMDSLWRRAKKRILASFADHGEPAPTLPAECPFTLAQLVDEELDIAGTVEAMREQWGGEE